MKILALTLAITLIIASLSPAQAEEAHSGELHGLADSKNEAHVRVRRGNEACYSKCKGMGKRGGTCKYSKGFFGFTCGRSSVCTCF